MIAPNASATFPGLAGAAERVLASVVQVRAGVGRSDVRQGSGVVWRRNADGSVLVVSNAHVANVMPVRVVSSAGTGYDATLTACDAARDLSLLHVANAASDLAAAEHAVGPQLRAGEFVVAVGHPFGVRNAVSTGVVHAVGPLITGVALPAPQRDADWLQLDLRLGPGNSGGPLVDSRGRVVGISTMIVGGLALAVPHSAIEAFVNQAVQNGSAPIR